MSASAMFGIGITSLAPALAPRSRRLSCSGGGGGGATATVIECSSRPQKKSTAHHRKSRPKKSQPWDIKRKPTLYAPLPPLPLDYTLVSEDSSSSAVGEAPVSSAASSS